VRSYLN
jgi:hypothetical protein